MTVPEKSDLFLTDQELHELTGRKVRRLQIEQLSSMLISFHVNALGRPVVTHAAVIGMQQPKQVAAPKVWALRVGDPWDVGRLSISTYRPACARRKARAGSSGTTTARASSLMERAHGFRSDRAFRMHCAPMPSRLRQSKGPPLTEPELLTRCSSETSTDRKAGTLADIRFSLPNLMRVSRCPAGESGKRHGGARQHRSCSDTPHGA